MNQNRAIAHGPAPPWSRSVLAGFTAAILTGATMVSGSAQDAPVEGDAPPPEVVVPPTSLRPFQPQQRSKSASGQFLIYGESLRSRGAFGVFAEEVKAEYLGLIKQRDGWVFPIIIQIIPDRIETRDTAVRTLFEQIEGGGYRFRVFAELAPEFSRGEFRREVLRALMAEHVVRRHREVRTSGSLLPIWLFEGVSQAMAYRKRGRPSDLFSSILKNGSLLEAEEILTRDPTGLDSVSRATYNASCGALVLALLHQPSGPDHLNLFISRLGSSDDEIEYLVKKTFPGFRVSRNSIEKWWALEVAAMAEPTVFDVLSVQRTDALIDRAVEIHYTTDPNPIAAAETERNEKRSLFKGKLSQLFRFGKKSNDGDDDGGGEGGEGGDVEDVEDVEEEGAAAGGEAVDGGPGGFGDDVSLVGENPRKQHTVDGRPVYRCALAEFRTAVPNKKGDTYIHLNRIALLKLETRAFPLLRPVIREYQTIFEKLEKGKTRGLGDKIAALADRRKAILDDAQNIEDYLDWFEATQQTEKSGAFEGYRRALKQIRDAERPRRDDEVSRYLDALERELGPD